MQRRRFVQYTSAALAVAAALAVPSVAQAKDKVVLMLNWYVYSEHAPFFLGMAQGLYDKQGIDLEIQEGRGSAVTVQAVGAGSATFGYADIPTMIKAAAKGAPVQAVGVALQTSPMSVIGFESAGVKTAKDIAGKTVAMTPGDSMSQIWPLFLQKAGLKDGDFKTVSGDGQTKLNAVVNGQADVLLGYVMDQAIKLQDATHKPTQAVRFADYGVNLISSGIVANKDTLADKADLVKRFMAATTQAFQAAEKDPQAAIDATLKSHPKSGQPDTMLTGLKQTTALYHTADTKDKPPFAVTMKNVNDSLDMLIEYGGLDASAKGQGAKFVTLDYLPK